MSEPSNRLTQGAPQGHKGSPPRRLLIRFAVACLLTYGMEFWLHHSVDAAGQSHNFLTESIFGVETFYHELVTASPRKPAPRFTALITLSDETLPAGVGPYNRCGERYFFGEMLKTLSHAKARVVVFDKYFGTACGTDNPETRNFIAGAQALCEAHITLVVGRVVDEALRPRTPAGALYPLEPAFDFQKQAPCVTESVLNISKRDLRRLVLWWNNIQPVAGSTGPPPTLAMAASLAASPSFLLNGRLAGWTPNMPPPYVSFVRRGQFDNDNIAARDLVCNSTGSPGWRACADNELSPKVRSLADGRVVVIGEDYPNSDSDRHSTVVGELPGFILQANYIESLLDDRLIRPVPEYLNILTGLIFFGAFEFVTWRYHEERLHAFGLVVLLFLGAALMIYLSVTLFGYYLNPTTIGILAVLLKLAETGLAPAERPAVKEQHA